MASAEIYHDALRNQVGGETVLSKKVRITVKGDINGETEDSFYTLPPPPPPTLPLPRKPAALIKQVEETDGLVRPPIDKDTETWVSRIMHPWIDSHLCCPGQYDPSEGSNAKSVAVGSILLDQTEESTIASDSIKSSTPILSPLVTSSDDVKSGADEKEEKEPAGNAVLGIRTRSVDPEAPLVLEEVVVEKKKKTRGRSLSPYRSERGNIRRRSPSAWRKKAWTRLDSQHKHNGTAWENVGVIEDDFDIESFSEFGHYAGDPLSSYAEI